jgi:hypothetical protein
VANPHEQKTQENLILAPADVVYGLYSRHYSLDKLRPLGTNTLTVYASTSESCLTEPEPKVTVETTGAKDSSIKLPEPSQIQEFKAEAMFK